MKGIRAGTLTPTILQAVRQNASVGLKNGSTKRSEVMSKEMIIKIESKGE